MRLGLAALGIAVVLVAGLAAAGLAASQRPGAVAGFKLIGASKTSPVPSPAVSPPSQQNRTGQKPVARVAGTGAGAPNGGCEPWISTLTLNSFSVSTNGAGVVRAAWSASDSCTPPYLILMQVVYNRSDGVSYPAHYQLPWLVGSMQWSFNCTQAPYVTVAQHTLSIQDGANHLVVKAYPWVAVCR